MRQTGLMMSALPLESARLIANCDIAMPERSFRWRFMQEFILIPYFPFFGFKT